MTAIFPKTKVYYIRGDVDQDMVNTVFSILNEEGAHIRKIYFSSGGGDMSIAEVISDAINNSEHKIEFIAMHVIFSAAFDILFNLDSAKVKLDYMEKNLQGMVHLPGLNIRINTLGDGNSQDDRSKKLMMMASHDSFISSLISFGINKNEIKRVLNDDDVYLSSKRMKQLIDLKIRRENGIK